MPEPLAMNAASEFTTIALASGVIPGKNTRQYEEAARRKGLVELYVKLQGPADAEGPNEMTPTEAVECIRAAGENVSRATLDRWRKAYEAAGFDGLLDRKDESGRRPEVELTPDEESALMALYARTNLTETSGSMQTAAKFFALDPGTREAVRHPILAALAQDRVPYFVKRCLEKVTAAHIEGIRRPGLVKARHFSGKVGAFSHDKLMRKRVIESDDGTLNFVGCIPWPMGGDPCSDKFRVRIGRWQILPAIECGWSHAIKGYALIGRPRGSYRSEDILQLVKMVAEQHGLPDEYRFEHGAWEAKSVTNLLKGLGVPLTTVNEPTHKPFIEGFFGKMWTYLSVLDGQVGRFRGDMERENVLTQKCKAGRADPRDHFPMLDSAIRAIDGSCAMHNSDTIKSIYGSWVPEVRDRELKQERAWKPLPEELNFLFSPFVREWTVAKGTVGGKIWLLEDFEAPFYFINEELWRWNGHKVRVYFDPSAEDCRATIVSLENYHGYAKHEIICQAELTGELPHFARAAMGWADEQARYVSECAKVALSAFRRDVRALDSRGTVKAAVAEHRDDTGRVSRVEIGTPRRESKPAAIPERIEVRTADRETQPREREMNPLVRRALEEMDEENTPLYAQ